MIFKEPSIYRYYYFYLGTHDKEKLDKKIKRMFHYWQQITEESALEVSRIGISDVKRWINVAKQDFHPKSIDDFRGESLYGQLLVSRDTGIILLSYYGSPGLETDTPEVVWKQALGRMPIIEHDIFGKGTVLMVIAEEDQLTEQHLLACVKKIVKHQEIRSSGLYFGELFQFDKKDLFLATTTSENERKTNRFLTSIFPFVHVIIQKVQYEYNQFKEYQSAFREESKKIESEARQIIRNLSKSRGRNRTESVASREQVQDLIFRASTLLNNARVLEKTIITIDTSIESIKRNIYQYMEGEDGIFGDYIDTFNLYKTQMDIDLRYLRNVAENTERIITGVKDFTLETSRKELEKESVRELDIEPMLDLPRKLTSILTESGKKILRKLFRGRIKISVEPFASGLSGATNYLVVPKDKNNKPKAPYVVKIGKKEQITTEHTNYRKIVQPAIQHLCARIDGDVEEDSGLAGIKYTTVTGKWARGDIRDFKEFYETTSTSEICDTLGRLFKGTLAAWYSQLEERDVRYREKYNKILPTEITIEGIIAEDSTIKRNKYDEVDIYGIDNLFRAQDNREIISEKRVCLSDLRVAEIDDQKIRTFDEDYGAKIDIFVLEPSHIEKLAVNQKVNVIGKVVGTRDQFFKDTVAKIFPKLICNGKLNATTTTITENILTNPLFYYSDVLDIRKPNMKLSCIHGDLNLGNILVDRNNNPWLIDYALTQKYGHTAFDFAKLETEIKTHIVAAKIDLNHFLEFEQELMRNTTSGFERGPFSNFSCKLKKAIEVISRIRRFALGYVNLDEYLCSLLFYSLAVLKFKNLDKPKASAPNPKQLSFIAAAVASEALQRLN